MRRLILCSMALLFSVLSLMAQDFTELSEIIESNNLSLKAQRARMEAQTEQLNAEIALEDPELEYAHLWGPGGIGRNDIAIRQKIDFASISGAKKNFALSQLAMLKAEYALAKKDILLQACNLYSQIIYYNACIADLEKAILQSQNLEEAYRQGFEAGEFSKIDYRKASLQLVEIESELEISKSQRESLLAELNILNGGQTLSITSITQPALYLPKNFSSWIEEVIERNQDIKYYKMKQEAGESGLKLAKANAIPSLTIGYMAELVPDSNFHGPSVGISLPLWSSGKKIKAAQKEISASKIELEATIMEFRAKAQSLYNKASTLSQRLNLLESYSEDEGLLDDMNNALELGQMSLIDYINELALYYKARQLRYNVQMDYTIAINELFSIAY